MYVHHLPAALDTVNCFPSTDHSFPDNFKVVSKHTAFYRSIQEVCKKKILYTGLNFRVKASGPLPFPQQYYM